MILTLIFLMAATISTRLLGRGTSMVPMYWKRSRTVCNKRKAVILPPCNLRLRSCNYPCNIWSKPLNTKQRREQNTSLDQFQPSPLLSNFDSRQHIKLFLLNKQMILVDWFIYRYIFELFLFVSQGQAF